MTQGNCCLKVTVLAACAAVSGCYPAPYSQEFSGRVIDEDGKPVVDAFAVNLAYKECGSLGGKSTERLKSSVVRTDSSGRYRNHIRGISTFYTVLIGGCGSYSFESVACKAGFQPSNSGPAINAEFRLSPGIGWSHVNLPPECSAKMITKGNDNPTPKSIPIPLWSPRTWIYPVIRDPGGPSAPYPDMPVVSIDEVNPRTGLWLVVSERMDSESNAEPDIRVVQENNLFFTKNYGVRDGIYTTYVFVLASSTNATRAIINEQGLGAPVTYPRFLAEPVGGIKWTLGISDSRRIEERISLEGVAESDWRHLRPHLAAFNMKPGQGQCVLCDPGPK